KIAIPDHILNKPGKLTFDEWEIMKTHAQIGCDILSASELTVLNAGAILAGEHHENWDGSGYPEGKKGEGIHIYGRITAIADVFDALVNKRCYKPAWSIVETMDFFREMTNVKFDPKLVELVFKHQSDLMAIQDKYTD
ncbi:MAG: HD domain-containing protein, partial [Colwellia sp.]|nr:HD domain-containing protein [Colwellia sp.]